LKGTVQASGRLSRLSCMLTIFSAERGPVLPVVDEQPVAWSAFLSALVVSFGALHVGRGTHGGTSPRDRMSRHGPQVRISKINYRMVPVR